MHHKFNDIRPFCTSEIPEAMQVIAESEHFELLARYIFPDRDVEEVREMIRTIRTTDELPLNVMYYVNEQIVRRSITRLTQNSFAHLDPRKPYLFVSNHRDIMLDSSLLQYILHINGFRTTEITFGSNLMQEALVTNIGRANKMFKVIRSSNLHDFLKNSMLLSEYIRHTLTQKGESVWIAQRNGRTKDGHDATDQGMIKMFCMSDKSDLPRSVGELNIVPMAISYQIEPCDILKTRELYLSQGGEKYVKQPDEDLNSILTGIMQPKGRVHLSLGNPITYEQLPSGQRHANEFYKGVASLIDKQIYAHYKLYDNNYIAHDMRSGTSTYADRYTLEAKKIFEERCNAMLQQLEGDRSTLLNIFLGIYANPVDNAPK